MGYLDKEGLKRVWGKINNGFYTKSAVDGLLGGKTNSENPRFNGIITGGAMPGNIDANAPYLGPSQNVLTYIFQRGGTCVLKDLETGDILSEGSQLADIFDGTPSYHIFDNQWPSSHRTQFIIKLPFTFEWTSRIYIDFGIGWGGGTYCLIEGGYSATNTGNAKNPDSDIKWVTCVETSEAGVLVGGAYVNYNVTSSNRLDYIRITIGNWKANAKRVCEIAVVNSMNRAIAEGHSQLCRGGDVMYGDINYESTSKGLKFFAPDLQSVYGAVDSPGGDGGAWFAGVGNDNLRISSWFSIGFHDNCYGNDYISMNLREGIFRAKKLQDTDTGKQTSIGDIATITELDEVRKIAEGKTDTYAVKAQNVDSTKYCNNKLNIAKTVLSTTSVRIDKQGITKLLDINKVEIDLSTLKIGDIVFTAEQTIKDWWFAGTTAAYYLFYGFDADTPDLSGYAKLSDLSNYVPATDFNNLKDSLGTASGCDYAAGIEDVLIEPSVPGAKKQLPTVGAVRTFVNTWFVRKASLGTAASYGVDSTSDSINKDSANLPTTGAMLNYIDSNYIKSGRLGDAAFKGLDTGSISYPGSKEKVPTTYAIVEYVHNDAKTKIKTIRAGTNNGETFIGYEYTNSSTCIVKGLNNAAYKDVDDTITSLNGVTLSKNLPTSAAVANYLASNLKTINGNPIFGKGDIPLTIATLPSTGSMSSLALTDRLDLQNAPYGIKFSPAAYAVTNMEAGEVEIVLGKYVNNDASASVTFHNGSKGQGTWKVLATVTGKTWVTSVTCTIESITTSGFKIWVRRLVDTSSNSASGTVTVDWFAIKYW